MTLQGQIWGIPLHVRFASRDLYYDLCLRSLFLLTVSCVLLVPALFLLTVSNGIVCVVSPIAFFIDSLVRFASPGAAFADSLVRIACRCLWELSPGTSKTVPGLSEAWNRVCGNILQMILWGIWHPAVFEDWLLRPRSPHATGRRAHQGQLLAQP